MNKNILEVIEEQIYPNDEIINVLDSIANVEFNKRQRKNGSILPTIVDCYQYGLIMGKRQERLRRKNMTIDS